MTEKAKTWHFGLVARYWAERITDGPEIAYFQKLIEHYGQPALDAGCGTGRLLLPFLRAGLDVDGCDVSSDMLVWCRKKGEDEGLKPRLYEQALHELDLPRSYQTIVACGVFGIGGDREQDRIALQRFYQHLAPGGVLLMDNHTESGDAEDAEQWKLWRKAALNEFPDPWPKSMLKAPPVEGLDYNIWARVLAFDPLERQVTRQIRALMWHDGQFIADEAYTLYDNIYFRDELRQMLEQTGFEIEAIQGAYTEEEATADHGVIVYIARKP